MSEDVKNKTNYIQMKIQPRFKDTDALGHINNASISTWFEESRREIFKIFIPDLDPKKWNLIVARVETDYLAQTSYQEEVLVECGIERIGNSSFKVFHRAFQNSVKVAEGRAHLVHFDYKENKSISIPKAIRDQLMKFYIGD
ncbi:MAG: thioesterase family protein [Bdellovibrionota bacterium]